LHRKLGGLFLLAIKLKARVDMQSLFAPYNEALLALPKDV